MNASVEVIGHELSNSDGPILFVVDARNRLERKLLETWIQSPDRQVTEKKWVALTISRKMRASALVALAQNLEMAGETCVVPVRVAWPVPDDRVNKPISMRTLIFGDRRRPSLLRAYVTLRKDRSRAKVLVGVPASIDDLKNRFAQYHATDDANSATDLAAFVIRQASVALDIAERRLHGSRYKVPRFVADSIISSRKFRDGINKFAAEQERPKHEVYADVRGYMKELIAIPSAFYIDLRARFDKFLLSLGYDERIIYDEKELQSVREIVRDQPTIILWTHKTHMDGAAVSRIFYRNDLPIPHMFGGINMSFAGAGFLLRRSGAIFIRRSFQDNPLYKFVLRSYIAYLLEKRFPMTWAFEGTRSRLGKLMPPRYGLLKYVLGAAHASGTRNLHIIPVTISYDLIRDVEDYATEQTGLVKTPESLRWAIGYISSLRQPMGRIYMDFGEPVVLDQVPDPEDSMRLAKTAFDVAVNANKVTPLTMPSLVCLCLLGAAPRALTVDELQTAVLALVDWAQERGIRVSSDFDRDRVHDVRDLLWVMVDSDLLVRYDQGSDVVYGIEPGKHAIASYYRNTVIHHFVNKAILELSLLKASDLAGTKTEAADIFWRETERLRDLFKFEFFYPSSKEFKREIQDELSRNSVSLAKIVKQRSQGRDHVLAGMQPLVAHATLLIFVEAYTVVLDLLARLSTDQHLDEKQCVSNALKEGRQAYLQRRITSEASIGKILFQNGYKLANNLGLADSGDENIIVRRAEVLREFKDLSERLERVAAIARRS